MKTDAFRMRPALVVFALACATASSAQEAAPIALDFRAAQQRLVERSDAVEAQNAHLRSLSAQEAATRTLRRPDLDVDVQLLDYQKTLILPLGPFAAAAGSLGVPDRLRFQTERSSTRPIATATLPIYTGGQIPATQAGARAQVAQAKADLALTVEGQLLQLTQAYFGQQLAERALGVRRDVLAGLERHASDAAKLEQERFISRAQRLQAEVARDDAAREYEKAISDLASANAVLAGLLRAPTGVRPTSLLSVNSSPLPPRDTYLAGALKAHPQLERFQAIEEQAQAGLDLQRAQMRPTVYGFAQYNFDREESLLTDPDWSFGVGVKYKLLSGLGRRQMVEAARETRNQAEAGRREAETQIIIGVTKFHNEAEAARRRFLLLDSSITSAEENLRLQTLSYREQQATSLDVIDAELGLGKARLQRAQAANDYIQALAQLLNASGRMNELPDYLTRADRVIP